MEGVGLPCHRRDFGEEGVAVDGGNGACAARPVGDPQLAPAFVGADELIGGS